MFTLRNFVNLKPYMKKAFASSNEALKPERETISPVSFTAPSENRMFFFEAEDGWEVKSGAHMAICEHFYFPP